MTLTVKCAGVRGNQYILMQDTTQLPSTVTSAIAGGSSVTGGGVFHEWRGHGKRFDTF